LAVTAVLLLSTIEATLSRIWRVDRRRPLLNRLLMFWAILTVGPLLLGVSFALSSDGLAAMQNRACESANVDVFPPPSSGLNSVLAVLAQSAAFTILFKLVPARAVRLRDAAIGGIFAGLGFQVLR
jgi:membrane protein